MDIFSKRGLTYCYVKDSQAKKEDCHIILCDEPNDDEIFTIPYYVTYVKNSKPFIDAKNDLKSSKRKKCNKLLKNSNISFSSFVGVPKDIFSNWFENIYKPLMLSKEKGRITVKDDWTEKDPDSKFGVVAKDGEKIIGGLFGKKFDANKEFDERVSISYSAFSKDSKYRGLSEVCNLHFLDLVKRNNVDLVNRGRDFNMYGVNLSLGLPKFKSSLDFKITPYEKYGSFSFKISNLDLFDSDIFFLSIEKGKVVGNLIHIKGNANKNLFYLQGLSKLKVFEIKGSKVCFKEIINLDS